MPTKKLWIVLAALPTLVAIFVSNALFLQQDAGALIALSSIAFTAGSVAFGLVWTAAAGMTQQVETPGRNVDSSRGYLSRSLWEVVLVAIAIAWLYVVFDGAMVYSDMALRPGALLAGYAIATAWWVLQLLPGSRATAANPYLFAFLISAATVAGMLWVTDLPLPLSLLPGAAVLAYVGMVRVMGGAKG